MLDCLINHVSKISCWFTKIQSYPESGCFVVLMEEIHKCLVFHKDWYLYKANALLRTCAKYLSYY